MAEIETHSPNSDELNALMEEIDRWSKMKRELSKVIGERAVGSM
jgi:hypothetical protein